MPGIKIRVNINAKVNATTIRRETYNGRDHWVLPSYTLPANVIMNGGLYPASEIDAHYKGLEGTMAPLGHPTMDGKFISAFSPEGVNIGHVGAWNRNVKKSGNRIFVEKWLDVEVAGRSEGGKRLLDRLEALEKGEDVPPIHTSVAVFLEQIPVNANDADPGYEWTAKIFGMDHDAILLDEVGAATPEQGVGIMVNADNAVPMKVNEGALEGITYRDRERMLDEAARKRWVLADSQFAYIVDMTDDQCVVLRYDGVNRLTEVYEYKIENGAAIFADTGAAVEQKTTWVEKLTKVPAVNKIIELFNRQVRPGNKQEGDMPLTPQERAELATEVSAEVGKALATNFAAQLKPLTDKIEAIELSNKTLNEGLTANARAAEAEKRVAVEAKFGKAVADALTGNALEEMYKQCGVAAPLTNGALGDRKEYGAPEPGAYFGGAK